MNQARYAPTPGPTRLGGVPRYLDSELRRLGAFVTAKAGEVYPGPVLMLNGESYATQSPTSNTAAGVITVSFGPAVGTSADIVSLDAAGVLTFRQSGSYLLDLRIRAEAGNNALLASRALLDGAAIGGPWTSPANPEGVVFIVSNIYTIQAGQLVTFELGRDGAVNSGSLVAAASGLGWADIPSAAIRILKF